MQQDDQVVYTVADKGLGICAVELCRYQKWCLKHLTKKKTYKLLSKEEAWAEAYKLRDIIYKWTVKHKPTVGKDAINYIRAQLAKDLSDPFAYFYVMPKIHKAGPKGSHTRPVSSSCGSLQQPLSKWLSEVLLPLATAQKLHVKKSFFSKEI